MTRHLRRSEAVFRYDGGTNKDGPGGATNTVARGLADWIGVD